MLKQASVAQIRSGEVNREQGMVVIAMCRYPRALRRELRDSYESALGPSRELLADFLAQQTKHGHERGFAACHYQERFTLTEGAHARLGELAEQSRKRDVFLVCQCTVGERCHRELLLLLAGRDFRAKVGKVFHAYPTFLRREDVVTREEDGPPSRPRRGRNS